MDRARNDHGHAVTEVPLAEWIDPSVSTATNRLRNVGCAIDEGPRTHAQALCAVVVT
jgi:hypothetical protein